MFYEQKCNITSTHKNVLKKLKCVSWFEDKCDKMSVSWLNERDKVEITNMI